MLVLLLLFRQVKPALWKASLPKCFFLAEAVGFEPTDDFTRHSISSRDRYDHFDTPPYFVCMAIDLATRVLYTKKKKKSRAFSIFFDFFHFHLFPAKAMPAALYHGHCKKSSCHSHLFLSPCALPDLLELTISTTSTTATTAIPINNHGERENGASDCAPPCSIP